jgi:membrane fusion protein (multidrug efflux system)
VSVGDYLKDGADIVALEDLSSVWIDFRLPERFIARVRTGQAVEVDFDSLPGRKFKAAVEALDSQLDTNGRSLLVRARLPNLQAQLKTGMFARTRIVFSVREGALMVPEEALVPQGNDQFIFKLVDGADGKPAAQRMKARIGLRVPGKAEILEGLAEGDRVVTAGHARLRGPNVPVRVIDLSKPPGPPGGAGGAGRPASGPRPASTP